ncbi:MBL fold metallo-hydrolase [Mucilaginibacter sp. RS28]|uniref:MBL fold metallo-hydrolase n=1 Tax=Mucilaginibacter straminoryzae TaxID=2932774 RepID=A0A9X1X5T8_9SPHI|nr:MBL fold metallo-hydrolase [Mucilaginibacter straminoryzae]MCJ8209179.1 MBL fold metallo-hydrolase [Mucilaginibacter straminoryzae]
MKDSSSGYFEVAPGVYGLKIIFVNIYMVAGADGQWVLVDAGIMGSAGRIKKMAEELFGDVPPSAIILTHAHFDHRGALPALLKTWDVPVYAHNLELPYLRGLSSYPPPDPTVGGGLMSLLSVLYPKKPLNLGDRVRALPQDGSVPFLNDWIYIPTPGHAPGHISLFRGRDKVLIAGDAFVTTKQESAYDALTFKKVLSGPPKYFTPDWISANDSVIRLRDLHPHVAATGHGVPMQGEELAKGLDHLVNTFNETAVPAHGRYVHDAAKMNKRGVQYVPPQKVNPVILASAALITGVLTYTLIQKIKK